MPETGEPSEILGLIERHRVTIGFANPDLLDALTRSSTWTTADLSSMRFCITGGAPVPERLIRTYQARGVNLLQGYGLSEASPFVLLLDAPSALRKIGAAGGPPVFVDVHAARPDGAVADADETGELLVRGPNVMAGYWDDPDATRAAIDDGGWLHTGDAARVDEDGDVWIVGRMAERLRYGGTRRAPRRRRAGPDRTPGVLDAAVAAEDGEATAFVVPASSVALELGGAAGPLPGPCCRPTPCHRSSSRWPRSHGARSASSFATS